jgi:hypothetical protein
VTQPNTQPLSIWARTEITVTLATAAVIFGYSLTGVASDLGYVLGLGLLYVVASQRPALLGARHVAVTMSTPVVIGAMILMGPRGAAVVAGFELVSRWRVPILKHFYNAAQIVLASFVGGAVFVASSGGVGLTAKDFPWVVGPVVVAECSYCIVNGILLIGVLHLVEKSPPLEVWRSALSRGTAVDIAFGLFGLLVAGLWVDIGPGTAVLIVIPLAVARWVYAQHAEQRLAYDRTMRALIQAVETKDVYTRGHSERVAAGATLIGRRLALSQDRLAALYYAALLHDVGKLGVPTSILRKTTPLTVEELAVVALHPVRGLELLRDIGFLGEALGGIVHHHERLDGLGYPLGLVGDAVPEFARIIAVADAFDSMTSMRPYRAARSAREALAELRRCEGTQFDARLVEAFSDGMTAAGWNVGGFESRSTIASLDAVPPLDPVSSPAVISRQSSER